ncbi:zinc finger protein 518B [Oryzias melastigma]|nr:zinc finger protein 518B [Oryzias melastigma]XP_024120666.1 zinc finger protein 518B [Oryzias melastigma]
MDLVNICATTSAGENKGRVNKQHKNWHKRLHLRKTGVQPPAMQSQDKHGPKKITGEWEQPPAWPSSKKPPQEAAQSWHSTHSSANTLRFACSQCKDNLEYVPKDLVRHFEEKHSGKPPVFSCHMCTFSTQEFSYLHVHLLSHSDSFSSCTMCNDNVQRSWPEFRAHMTMHHCSSGKYSCEMCHAFSTGDIHVFLQHLHGHNVELGEADVQLSQHNQDKNLLLAAKTFHCRYCGFEASRKMLITKHVKAVHVCQNGNQWKEKRGVHPIAVKPQDRLLRTKPRLTRSAVKGTCWLSQNCLSLPGREFLDKYCHLSDPKTTLEETEQFLMRSVTGETDDQKWTKALKSVLSNVPQDLHPKGENGVLLNPSDLTVLTVKNKITLAQNGATYSKRLKMMASAEKDTAGGAVGESARGATENGLRDQTVCPEPERGPCSDVSPSAHTEPAPTLPMQPNKDNLELKSLQVVEELCEKLGEHGIRTSSDLKLTGVNAKKKAVQKTQIIGRRQNPRRKRKTFRKAVKRSEGWALKMVLKKNPVKQKLWVSQESVSASEGDVADGRHAAVEEEPQTPQALEATEEHQANATKGSTTENLQSPEARMLVLQSEFSTVDGERPGDEVEPEPPQEAQNELFIASEVEVDQSGPAGRRCLKRAASMTEDQNVQLQKPSTGANRHVVEDEKKLVAAGAMDGRSSAVCPSADTPEGVMDAEVSLLKHSSEQRDDSAVSPEEASPPCQSVGKAIQQESSPASGQPRQPAPKHQERTLKLVAINPSQLVKRPSGDQPVVVLNHPDADIPQVVKIMEVVSRHREVQKVVLSRRTLEALSASSHETTPEEAWTGPARPGDGPVQERFTLKFKFRRLNRKKYEIVGIDSPSRDFAVKFSCWFCGRIFTCQETMMSHRQRHLIEWKRPNCENS